MQSKLPLKHNNWGKYWACMVVFNYCIPALLHTASVTERCQYSKVRCDDYLANSTYLKSGTITSEINPFEHGAHLQVSFSRRQVVCWADKAPQTEEHRACQSERSKAQWAAEKKAGNDRGKAKLALRDPEVETRRRKAIKENYELKKLLAHRVAVSRLREAQVIRSVSPCLGTAGTLGERTSAPPRAR